MKDSTVLYKPGELTVETMSQTAYAVARGADRQAVRRAVAAGIIKLDADGRIDPEQADAAWASTLRASPIACATS